MQINIQIKAWYRRIKLKIKKLFKIIRSKKLEC